MSHFLQALQRLDGQRDGDWKADVTGVPPTPPVQPRPAQPETDGPVQPGAAELSPFLALALENLHHEVLGQQFQQLLDSIANPRTERSSRVFNFVGFGRAQQLAQTVAHVAVLIAEVTDRGVLFVDGDFAGSTLSALL